MGKVFSHDTEAANEAIERQRYLTFSVGGQLFGIAAHCVKEVIEYKQLTRESIIPALVRGVLRWKGVQYSLIDLGPHFGVHTEINRLTSIVIVESVSRGKVQGFGLIVDAVKKSLEISPETIQCMPVPDMRTRSDAALGVSQMRGRRIILLDIGRLITADENMPWQGGGKMTHSGRELLPAAGSAAFLAPFSCKRWGLD